MLAGRNSQPHSRQFQSKSRKTRRGKSIPANRPATLSALIYIRFRLADDLITCLAGPNAEKPAGELDRLPEAREPGADDWEAQLNPTKPDWKDVLWQCSYPRTDELIGSHLSRSFLEH